MSRRNWIKIYPEGFLRRTLFKELIPIERWVWIGFLCLAGDNALDGKICVTEEMGYTDEQLAKLLDTDLKILKSAKNKMVEFKKISVNENNVVSIVSWNTYQSEYQRQRDYRQEREPKVTTQSYNAKLRIDRDIDIDKEKDKEIKNNIPYSEILNYLNEKAGTNFQKVEGNIKWIFTRWKEKYTLEDFYKVIDIKCDEWKTDKKYCKFLRPETLFGNKFDSYLNNKVVKTKTVNMDDINWDNITGGGKDVKPESI